MKRNIIILNGSPRRNGNTSALCDTFTEGAEGAGHSVTRFNLQGMNIHGCLGCMKGGKDEASPCVQKDDMAQLLEKLVSADVIVIATPVYFYCVSAQLKVMIDRLCPRYTEIADKRFYLIATAAEDAAGTFDGTVAGFRGMLDCLPGAVEAGLILCGGVWKTGEVQSHSGMSEAFEAGYSIQ